MRRPTSTGCIGRAIPDQDYGGDQPQAEQAAFPIHRFRLHSWGFHSGIALTRALNLNRSVARERSGMVRRKLRSLWCAGLAGGEECGPQGHV
jgi:hypothetical protein